MIITIDGPAASGKSTTAKILARKLNWLYMDTGAMYRAVAVKVLNEHIYLDDMDSIAEMVEHTHVQLKQEGDGLLVYLDGVDVSSDIRSPEVDKVVGPICEVPKVREVLVALQRQLGSKGNVIAEGRDMGTVVFPEADFKFFMSASIEERAKRRQKDFRNRGIITSIESLKEEIERRDTRDSQREHSPLIKAQDAIIIDTTQMDIDDQVCFIMKKIQAKTNQIVQCV